MSASTAEPGTAELEAEMGRLVWASVLGTVVEWYDFLIYGTAAALVFNKLFFPQIDPVAGTLAAFGAYAVGFVARPVGGAIFGHFGDRVGRKAMLTLTMLIMGLGTVLIGCLPTYADWGIWAAVALVVLRLLQGIGLGGEWGGAVLMVIEHAPDHRRGYYGSLVQVGFALGVAASTATFLAALNLPEAAFLSWGWRLPFLASAALIGIGLFVRLRLVETPAFRRVQQAQQVSRAPLLDVLRAPRTFLIAVGMKVSEVAWVYVLTVFVIVYGTTRLGLSRSLILEGVLLAALVELATMPFFGWLSDKIGRRPLYIAGAILSALLALPVFMLMETRDPVVVVLTLTVAMSLTHGLMFAPQAAYMPELFGTSVRYSGASLGCQVAAAISGGFAPLIATALLAAYGAVWPIALYLAALGAVTLVSVLLAGETRQLDLGRA